jgi:hypothetical protein
MVLRRAQHQTPKKVNLIMARTSNAVRIAQRTTITDILLACKEQKIHTQHDIVFSIQEQMGDDAPHFATIKKIVAEVAPTIKLPVVVQIGRPKDTEAWKIARLAFFNGIKKGFTTHAEMVQYVKASLEAKGIERSRPDDIVREFRELYSKDLEVRAYTKTAVMPEVAA